MLWFCVALISPTSASLQQMFDLDQQPQPTYCWQYCSQRQPSADCYGLLLDEGLKEKRKKKLCHCRQKRMSRVVQRPQLPESPGTNTRNILHHMQELQDNRKQSDFI